MKKILVATLLGCLGIGAANATTVNGGIVPKILMVPMCSVTQSTYNVTLFALPGQKAKATVPFTYTCSKDMIPMLSVSSVTQNQGNGVSLTVIAYADEARTINLSTPLALPASSGDVDTQNIYLEGFDAATNGPIKISGNFSVGTMTTTFSWN